MESQSDFESEVARCTALAGLARNPGYHILCAHVRSLAEEALFALREAGVDPTKEQALLAQWRACDKVVAVVEGEVDKAIAFLKENENV